MRGYGGGKFLECELAIGAFNYLDVEGLVRHLCPLADPINAADYLGVEELQLIVLEQEQGRFRMINITDELAKYSPKPEDDLLPD